jgi:hypothetical protein
VSDLCPIGDCNRDIGDNILCTRHHTNLASALDGGLARLYVELNLALRPGQGGSDDPIVTTSKVRRLPISVDARSAQQDLLAIVTTAEAALRHANGWLPAPRRGREGPTLVGCCTVLHDHLDDLLRLPGGFAFARDLLAIIGRARFAAGNAGGRRPNRIDLPCPECDMRSLRRDNGTDIIACAYCGLSLTAQQLDDLLDPPFQREAA